MNKDFLYIIKKYITIEDGVKMMISSRILRDNMKKIMVITYCRNKYYDDWYCSVLLSCISGSEKCSCTYGFCMEHPCSVHKCRYIYCNYSTTSQIGSKSCNMHKCDITGCYEAYIDKNISKCRKHIKK